MSCEVRTRVLQACQRRGGIVGGIEATALRRRNKDPILLSVRRALNVTQPRVEPGMDLLVGTGNLEELFRVVDVALPDVALNSLAVGRFQLRRNRPRKPLLRKVVGPWLNESRTFAALELL